MSFVSKHSSGALTFRFISDYAITERGWDATINHCDTSPVVPYPCIDEFTDDGGVDGVDNYYSDNQDEIWTFHPNKEGQKVEVVLNYVETEKDYDYLYVYDGPDTSSTLIKTFSGSYPGVVSFLSTHSSGTLTFKFHSDHSITKRGWEATINHCYQSLPCTEEFTDNGGVDNKYSNNQNETWTYHPNEEGQKVEVDFNYVDLEEKHDYLNVYDGPEAKSSELIKTFMGYHPGVESIVSTHSSGALTFRFFSDHSITESGWEATINSCVNGVSRSLKNEVIVKQEQEQEDLGEEIRIYPNPVTSSLQIVIPSSGRTSGDSTVSIINILGKVLKSYTYKAFQSSLKIDLSHLSTGVYYVKVLNLEGKTVKKILKLDQ